MTKTIREMIREGYGTEPQKEQPKNVEINEADVDKVSHVQKLSWGYWKLIEDSNADNQND